MKILVTGAKGMIGSHLVTAPLAEGYEVVGVDRAGEDSRSKMLSFFKADLADREGLCRIMDENGVDRVIHLAALAHTDGEPDLSWERYYHINVECAKNVFEAAGDRPVLFISTIDVYGFFDGKKPVTGKTRIHPVSNYAKSKALAEKECRKLSHYSIYRLSPVYTDEVKRDIQKRYYLKYPGIAYQIGKGSEYEVLNVRKAVAEMVDWCGQEPRNNVRIIKDDRPMWTPDYIKSEKEAGRARIVLHIPRWMVKCGYVILRRALGRNEKTYLLNKAVYPLKSE